MSTPNLHNVHKGQTEEMYVDVEGTSAARQIQKLMEIHTARREGGKREEDGGAVHGESSRNSEE